MMDLQNTTSRTGNDSCDEETCRLIKAEQARLPDVPVRLQDWQSLKKSENIDT